MKFLLLLIIFVLSTSFLMSQTIEYISVNTSAWNFDESILVEARPLTSGIVLPFEMGNVYMNSFSGDTWNRTMMEEVMPGVYHGYHQSENQDMLTVRFDTETADIAFCQPTFWTANTPLTYAYASHVAFDTADSALAHNFLDLRELKFAYTGTHFSVGLKTEGGGIQNNNGGFFPTEYYIYITALINLEHLVNSIDPEAEELELPTDMPFFAMVNVNVPLLGLSPGVYKLNIGSEDISLDDFTRVANATASTIDNTLLMSCSIADITSDEDFGEWPNDLNTIATLGMTLSVNLSQQITFADSTKICLTQLSQKEFTFGENNPAFLESAGLIEVPGDSLLAYVRFLDDDGDIPYSAEVEVYGNEWHFDTYPMYPILNTDIIPGTEDEMIIGAMFDDDYTPEWLRFYASDDGNNIVELYFDEITSTDDDVAPLAMLNLTSYPNPFGLINAARSVATSISFNNPQAGYVKLDVYNSKGQLITNVFVGELAGGPQIISWDGTNNKGINVASGIYFARLVTATATAVQKIMFIK